MIWKAENEIYRLAISVLGFAILKYGFGLGFRIWKCDLSYGLGFDKNRFSKNHQNGTFNQIFSRWGQMDWYSDTNSSIRIWNIVPGLYEHSALKLETEISRYLKISLNNQNSFKTNKFAPKIQQNWSQTTRISSATKKKRCKKFL